MTRTEEAKQKLLDTNYVQLRTIDVILDEGTIILEGNVCSFFMKQMAQQAVLKIGNIQLQNNLIVN